MNTQSIQFSKTFGSILFVFSFFEFYPTLAPEFLKDHITGIVESVSVQKFQFPGRYGRTYVRDYLVINLQNQDAEIGIPYSDKSDAKEYSLSTKIIPSKEYTFSTVPSLYSTKNLKFGVDQITEHTGLLYQKSHLEQLYTGLVCFFLGIALWTYARKKSGS